MSCQATWSSNITNQPPTVTLAEAQAGTETAVRFYTAEMMKEHILDRQDVGKKIIQTKTEIVKSIVTGSVLIPTDGTIPQITEGTQYNTFTFTPISATSTCQITVYGSISTAAISGCQVALFMAGQNDAIAGRYLVAFGAAVPVDWHIVGFVATGNTNQITFSIRFGRTSNNPISMPAASTYFSTAGNQVYIKIEELVT